MIKIVNLRRFVISNVVLFVVIFTCVIAVLNNTYSYTEPKYKTVYAEEGDTLWNIANIEKGQNEYFKNTDVRDIIKNIKKVNNLEASNLNVGQKLLIPIN